MGQSVVVQIVKMHRVHALGDVSYPGKFLLFGWGRQMDGGHLSCFDIFPCQFEVESINMLSLNYTRCPN